MDLNSLFEHHHHINVMIHLEKLIIHISIHPPSPLNGLSNLASIIQSRSPISLLAYWDY